MESIQYVSDELLVIHMLPNCCKFIDKTLGWINEGSESLIPLLDHLQLTLDLGKAGTRKKGKMDCKKFSYFMRSAKAIDGG
jgi:hypothetical protein